MNRVYFPDTNFFEECGAAHTLPWSDLGGAVDHVHLIVPSTVIGEIDRHRKGGGRTARRARDASALFRKALEAGGDHTVDLKPSSPRITLALPPVLFIDYKEFPNLDRSRPDHQIAAECQVLARAVTDGVLLSNDTNLVLAARSIGMSPVLIPESWKLPPENDERDAEMIKVKEELRKYQSARPMIQVNFDQASIAITPKLYDFVPSEVDAIIEQVERAYPMATSFERSPPHPDLPDLRSLRGAWQPPTTAEITDYTDREYPRWLASVRKQVEDLQRLLADWSHEAQFLVSICNDGHANAENVRLTLTGFNGLKFLSATHGDDGYAEKTALKPPPAKPTGRYVRNALLDALGAQHRPMANFYESIARLRHFERDRHGFYWLDGRPDTPAEELVLTCAALPHQVEPTKLIAPALIGTIVCCAQLMISRRKS
jgi:hypothetical protein